MTDTQAITIADFISKHNLRFECHRVDSRPDGLMEDGGMRHWRCRIICTHEDITGFHPKGVGSTERSFGLYFSQGSAHTEAPTLADVLDCLASDAGGYENASSVIHDKDCGRKYAHLAECPCEHMGPNFTEWASEYGYDVDSRKAEKNFKAIKRQAQQLKRVIGTEAYEELLWNTERL